MPQNRLSRAKSKAVIAELAKSPLIADLDPIAARFVYSLRLIAAHKNAKRDPIPELAMRLGNIGLSAKCLALSQAISAIWPENILVSRFCCNFLTYDEVTIGSLVQAATNRDREEFDRVIDGFVRPDRKQRLWDVAVDLVVTEYSIAAHS